MDYQSLKKIVLKKGYKWFEEKFNPNLVGVRTELIQPNIYNDIMFVAWIDGDGKEKFFAYSQTTLPGKFWLNNPSRPSGCGILMPGQYVECWIKGTHGKSRPHDALVQYGGGVNVYRDNDKDNIPEFEGPNVKVEKNVYIGCNIHASWAPGERKTIDKDSAACQVAANNKHHETMMGVVNERIKSVLGRLPSNAEIMNDKKLWVKFSYTLLLEKDLK